MNLPFGKYRGLDVADPEIPVTYLKWLEEKDIPPRLRDGLNEEIRRREGDRPGSGKAVRR